MTVLGGTLLVRGLMVAVGAGLTSAFGPALAGLSDRGRDATRVLLAGAMLALLALARLLHDVAAAAAVEQGRRGRDALWVGLEVLQSRLPRAPAPGEQRALAGAALVALAVAAGRGRAGVGLALTVLLHQGALLGLAMLRASWLDWARRALPDGPVDDLTAEAPARPGEAEPEESLGTPSPLALPWRDLAAG
ncbi:MAG: hypothetical protein EOO75_16295 [Myxococcales bacterium]|nr:MAG: hypothetical protein EOO75_16295 [Myxococcales bacterium]